MTLDIAPFIPWIAALLSIFTFVTTVKGLLSSGERKLEERATKAESKLVEYDRRIQALEGEMRHMPDRSMTHKLELAMEKISGRLDTLDERLKPIASTNARLQEFLLEQAEK